MADRLKIYACSGVGENPIGTENVANVSFETMGTNTLTNTQAVNSLLTRISCAHTNSRRIDISEKERIGYFNEIDLFTVCLFAAQEYANNPAMLQGAGTIIGNLIASGAFDNDSTDDTERDNNLHSIIEAVKSNLQSYDGTTVVENAAFTEWWNNQVIAKNTVYLSPSEAAAITERLNSTISNTISGIGETNGWQNDKDISSLLTKASEHFIYLYFADSDLKKLPDVILEKRKNQTKTYQYVQARFVGIYGEQEDLDRIIHDGITQYFGVSPQNVCKDIANGVRKVKAVGVLDPLTITLIVTACVSIVTALITAVCDAVARSEEARYKALDDATIQAGQATSGDFDSWEGVSDGSIIDKINAAGENIGIPSGWTTPILFCLGGLLILNNRK